MLAVDLVYIEVSVRIEFCRHTYVQYYTIILIMKIIVIIIQGL